MVTKEEWATLDRKVQGWLDWRGKKEMEKDVTYPTKLKER